MFMDPMKVIVEAAQTECGECDDELEIKDVEDEIESEYEDTEEVEGDFPYDESMVHVFEQKSVDGESTFLIEADMLAKYMETKDITDVSEAISKIAEHNGIESDDVALVIESDEYVEEVVEEAKALHKAGNKKALAKANSTAKFLKNVKLKGIKVLKKKNKGKGKKRK